MRPHSDLLIILLLAVELATLALLWLLARLATSRIRRHRVTCPRDGRAAQLLVDETAGRASTPADVIRCSLLEHDPHRTCERDCVRALPVPPPLSRIRRIRPRALTILTSIFAALTFAGTAHATDATDDMSGRRELLMAHCPSAVPSSITQVTDIDGGVAVTVHAAPADAVALAEIRRRVQFQLEIVDRPERGAIEHTGLGTGSGRFGFCPGMVAHTSLAVDWTADGARMLIRADRAADIPRLRASTRRRAPPVPPPPRHGCAMKANDPDPTQVAIHVRRVLDGDGEMHSENEIYCLVRGHSVLAEHTFSGVPVVDNSGRCVGVVSTVDLARVTDDAGKRVADVMSRLTFVLPDNSSADAKPPPPRYHATRWNPCSMS
jgi:hypothetical protein